MPQHRVNLIKHFRSGGLPSDVVTHCALVLVVPRKENEETVEPFGVVGRAHIGQCHGDVVTHTSVSLLPRLFHALHSALVS